MTASPFQWLLQRLRGVSLRTDRSGGPTCLVGERAYHGRCRCRCRCRFDFDAASFVPGRARAVEEWVITLLRLGAR